MNLIFDTNAVLFIARDKTYQRVIDFFNPEQKDIFLSFVTIAETQAFAFRNNWGDKKMYILEEIFGYSQIVDIDNALLQTYINIDAYSQCKHADFGLYPFITPRNMGKHDLWIAATASFLNLQLITTDKDFSHLHNIFLNLRLVEKTDLRALF